MTIESEWEPEGYIDTDPDYFWRLMFKRKKRLLLRPQRAGRVICLRPLPWSPYHYVVVGESEYGYYPTRAQVAQAAYG